jgi:peptide/nickel transport system substrate-binding protein
LIPLNTGRRYKKLKKKIVWLVISSLMILSLVIASCGTAEEEKKEEGAEEEAKVVITEKEKETEKEEVIVEEEAGPKYGGEVSIITGESYGFDEVYTVAANAQTMKLTHQELFMGDWTIGPAGTGQCDWAHRGIRRFDLSTGCLADSWEIPELGTIILHIRQGVHYALDPSNAASRLLNGRELTADDVVYSLNTYITNPRAALSHGDTRFATITALDNETVKIVLPTTTFDDIGILGDFASIMPPELEKAYGLPLDWYESVGTGPFILTDFVPASSSTFIRNPNYWEKDPVGESLGNQLPYLDGVKYIVITDISSQLAAIRTAKVDIIHDVGWENAVDLQSRNPEILFKKFYAGSIGAIAMRTDKPELPYSKKDVRRALMMATDFETIKNDYFGGDAQINSFPICDTKEYHNAYLPLEEAPASVQELYVYNPEKAKQLLANAGYPDGFKTTIVCASTSADFLSIIKDMWSKVNIDLDIQTQEGSIFINTFWGRAYDELIYAAPGPPANVYICFWYAGHLLGGNMSYIDDPVCWDAKDRMMELSIMDPAAADAINKELMAYVLDQAWEIPTPAAPGYHFWWPWVKNYDGELSLGYDNGYNYTKYIWVDQNLKKSMGY